MRYKRRFPRPSGICTFGGKRLWAWGPRSPREDEEMSLQKRLLCTQRFRRVHRPFGWVDARLIREDWLRDCSPTAWALYLFWVTVADAQGLSYYADQSVAQRLRIPAEAVRAGRAELLRAGLLAYEPPLIQVLSLDGRPGDAPGSSPNARGERGRTEDAVLLGDLLRTWAQGGVP